jgi:hypothetical protein
VFVFFFVFAAANQIRSTPKRDVSPHEAGDDTFQSSGLSMTSSKSISVMVVYTSGGPIENPLYHSSSKPPRWRRKKSGEKASVSVQKDEA